MAAAMTEANTLARQLWHIAGSGDLEQLDELLSQGVDVNAGDRTGVTALMRAAYHGQLGMVRALIGYGANPNAKDRSGLTALMMAKHAGHVEIVEALGRFAPPDETEIASKRGTGVSGGNHAQQARATFTVNRRLTEEDVDALTNHDYSESPKSSQTARMLHEPLEIWEMVHTTQPNFDSPSAASERVFSTKTLALAVGALLICCGAVFGFLALRGTVSGTHDTPPQPAASEQLSTDKSLTKAPNKITRSANELTKPKPVESLPSERADPPAVASSTSSAKKSSASQRPKATKVSVMVPNQRKNVSRATKLEEDGNSKSAKKEPAPATDPVKPTIKQKPKVIEWP